MFQNLNSLQDIPKKLRGDVIEKAFEKAEFINLPKGEQDKYHKNLKVYRDLFNSFETAHNTGKKEGIEEEKLKIAKNLLLANMSVEFIVDTTGLNINEINQLNIEIL